MLSFGNKDVKWRTEEINAKPEESDKCRTRVLNYQTCNRYSADLMFIIRSAHQEHVI